MSAYDNGKSNPVILTGAPGPSGPEAMRTSMFLPNLMQAGDPGSSIPSALNAAPTAATLWRAFVRVAPLAIFAGLVVAALAVAGVYLVVPPKYPVAILIKVNSSKAPGVVSGTQEDVEFSMLKSFQLELVKSPQVIHRALEMKVSDVVKGMAGIQAEGHFVKDLPLVRAQADPIVWLQGIKSEPHLKSQEIIVVSASTRDRPEDMAIVMNALGKALEEENQAHEDQNQYKLIEQLEAKRTEGSTKLEQRWKVYSVRMRGIADEDQTKKMLDSAWQQFREDEKTLKDLGVQIVKAESAINNLSKAKDITQVPSDQVQELVKNDPAAAPLFVEQQKTLKELNEATKLTSVQSYLQPYADRKAAADQRIDDYKAQNYPEILLRYREKMMNLAAAEMQKQRDELANLKEQERKVAENVANDKGELLKIKPNVSLPPDVVALKNEILALESAQGDATKKIALLAFDAPKQRVTVHETAIVPGSVDYTRFSKLAGAGGLGGFFLALLAVSFREFRYRKICTTDEVSRGLGLPLIGTVPTLPDAARSQLLGQGKVDPVWQNQLLESVDTIRTLLLHNARAANTRVIMISSAVGGEGKTSLATQLAASLARAWKKTLLIDGDLRSPSAHKLFEVPQEPGFSEVLRGELGAADAVRSTPLSRLWIMPAGHWDSHAVQALAQDSVRTILEELKQQYDFIIFDSSPILPVADALLLGQNVDGVLLTVMRDLSRAPALHAAHQRLDGLGIKTLGAVMMGASNELGPLGYKYAAIARR